LREENQRRLAPCCVMAANKGLLLPPTGPSGAGLRGNRPSVEWQPSDESGRAYKGLYPFGRVFPRYPALTETSLDTTHPARACRAQPSTPIPSSRRTETASSRTAATWPSSSASVTITFFWRWDSRERRRSAGGQPDSKKIAGVEGGTPQSRLKVYEPKGSAKQPAENEDRRTGLGYQRATYGHIQKTVNDRLMTTEYALAFARPASAGRLFRPLQKAPRDEL
jgi:hypothetical protein